MEGSPAQLSLPLFEPNAEPLRPPKAQRDASTQRRKRAVASSRTVSHQVAPEGAAASSSPAHALLTTSEAAGVLRVHPRTVQRLVERGQLDAIHLGTAVRFDPQDVAELTARLKRSASQVAAASVDVLRPSRPVRISFGDRLRSQHHEHRARPA
jgi:excisionase family DNA binding protein